MVLVSRIFIRLSSSKDVCLALESLWDIGTELGSSVKTWRHQYRHGDIRHQYRQLIVSDVNEHPPVFDPGRFYSFNISEATSVGSSVFSLRQMATDMDITGQVAFYSLQPCLQAQGDGRHFFQISEDGSHVILSQPVDFDVLQRQGRLTLTLNLSATDNGSPLALSSFTTLTAHVSDVDDQGPAFVYRDCPRVDNFCSVPYFQAAIKCGFWGPLRLYPGAIQAVDRDTQNYSILYSISPVEPDMFAGNLHIDARTGEVHVEAVPCPNNMQEILLTVTARESSPLGHSISTHIQIKLVDSLVFANIAWNLPEATDNRASSSSSLSLTVLLIVLLAFIIVGSVLAVVSVRVSRKRKQNKIESTATSATMETNDCHRYHTELSKASSCLQTYAYNCSPNLSQSSGCNNIPATPTVRADRSVETFVPASTGDMCTAFMTAENNLFPADVYFSPSPSIPGRSNLNSFYDPNCSFGSMKHERILKGSRQAGQLKLTLTDEFPQNVRAMAQKVCFHNNTFNHSNV
ncbi:unnamed protein product [Candidula unifasciata]|uniref:Cadherin domain-containing protein n=1 Tax=Candidula unifasciata TaxID=100452 RepID=A0A8S3ZR43_9EUPU|nr:unnamed protein product [Candidula unifasciata]